MNVSDVARLVRDLTPEQISRIGHVDELDLSDSNVVYIGRYNKKRGLKASPFANPLSLPPDKVWDPAERKACLRKYTEGVLSQPGYIEYITPLLTGKTLACYCRDAAHPDALCHGLVLLALAESRYRDLRNGWVEEL